MNGRVLSCRVGLVYLPKVPSTKYLPKVPSTKYSSSSSHHRCMYVVHPTYAFLSCICVRSAKQSKKVINISQQLKFSLPSILLLLLLVCVCCHPISVLLK